MRLGALIAFLILCVPARAQIVINEILADNHFTLRDDADESSDWVELKNLGPVSRDLGGYSLSDHDGDPLKWTLPSVKLESGGHVLVWCSGDDRTFAREVDLVAPDSPLPLDPDPIPAAAQWRFFTGMPEEGRSEGDAFPSGWKLAAFDDSGWSRGEAGFGFGAEGIRTELPPGTGAVLFRSVFRLDQVSSRPLVLQVLFDDGFAAYLNGVLVASENFPPETEATFSSVSTAQSREGSPSRYAVNHSEELLVAGDNVVAIVLLNRRRTGAGSGDLFLFPQLGFAPQALHASFELAKGGEAIFLSDPRGTVVDAVRFPAQTEDHSYGRFPDGTGAFQHLAFPTPRAPNRGPPTPMAIAEEPRIEPEIAIHPGAVDVAMSLPMSPPLGTLRFTTDGSPPTSESTQYVGPIRVEQDTVVRAAAFLDDEQITRDATRSYFVSSRARDLELPILSLAMAPEDFRTVHTIENGGRESERAASFEIFNEAQQRVAQTVAGLRLHGGAGRGGGINTKKSYRVAFRDLYGDRRLRYPVIPETSEDTFDRLVLRGGFNDGFRSGPSAAYIRDQLVRDLHEDMEGQVAHGAWYNLFVNMEYRGVYNVVERMDESYFASYFPDDGTSWDVIKQPGQPLHGSAFEWERMVDFFFSSDFADQELYEGSIGQLNLSNFTSYMIVNVWAHNTDWPHNNWYAAKPRRLDGQWRFLCWDAERSVGLSDGGPEADSFGRIVGAAGPSAFVLRGLLRNVHYQRFFIEELERHLAGALAPDNVVAHIERLAARIEGDMRYEAAFAGQTVEQWRLNIETMKTFARDRNAHLRAQALRTAPLGAPRVLGVEPARLTPEGEVDVSLVGENFTEATLVFFAGLPSPRVEFVSTERLRAAVPFDLGVEGLPAIRVRDNRAGANTTTHVLEVAFQRPLVSRLEPQSGSPAGGDSVTVIGENFLSGARVEFGGVRAPSVLRESRVRLLVTTPPGAGRVAVRVINTQPGELSSTEGAEFSYVADEFLRGDADGSGAVNVADAIHIARFVAGDDPLLATASCEDALDADDSGQIDAADALRILGHLFTRSAAPVQPYPACGRESTPDELSCLAFDACR